ncbi:hypothetical protein PSm6_37840 [Pseudomonas solani]|uniref:Uncharacterized protein n=1 Tax=Pseudomonas solani TaxID=2731552 RepID=A0ABM7LCY3_9PSED|nr:hypothetical protein PSm6_37840 [Pseudomonas solani]
MFLSEFTIADGVGGIGGMATVRPAPHGDAGKAPAIWATGTARVPSRKAKSARSDTVRIRACPGNWVMDGSAGGAVTSVDDGFSMPPLPHR